jgi:hypothetical protein
MKKIIYCLILLSSSTYVQAQQTLDLPYSKNDFSIITDDGVTSIATSLKDRRVCGDSLSPDLPYFFYRIPLQQGQENVSVEVSYTDSLLCDKIVMVSNPRPSIRNEITQDKTCEIATKSVTSPLHFAGVKYQNDRGYLLLKVTPFLYDINLRTLRFVKNVHITFHGIPAGQDISPVSIHEALNTSAILRNTPEIPNDRTGNDTIDYLIITSNSLASSFNQLAQWKRRKCLRTKIVTLDSIYSKYPQFIYAQSKIKAYIMDYASPTRKKWVLLGGDDSVVPAKLCFVRDLSSSVLGDTTPSDWYYSCDEDDPFYSWDNNLNGKAGEVGDSLDYIPCVYLSRLPVRTAQQIEDYTEKLINYENGVNIHKNMLLAGYQLKANTPSGKSDSQYLNEKIYDEFVGSYWNGELKKLFDTGSSYQFTINGDNLNSVIDSCFNVIHEISHGDTVSWLVAANSSQHYTNSHAAAQINTPGSVVVTGACSTNAFDYEPCLSESFLRNPDGGALAYFGSSRPSAGGESRAIGDSIPILWVDQYNGHFLQYLYAGTPVTHSHSIAAIATEAKTTVYNEFGDEDLDINTLYHDHLLSMNIMGDPEMPVWTDSIHSFTSVNGTSQGPYLIHSTSGGILDVISPVDSCTIAVLDEHGTRQVAYNTNGATFYGLDGSTYVAIMKHNYIPYLITTTVRNIGIIGPIIHATQSGGGLDIYIEAIIENAERESLINVERAASEWQLTITNMITGNTKVSQAVKGNSIHVSTSGWTSGIYGIQVNKNGSIASTKVFIK